MVAVKGAQRRVSGETLDSQQQHRTMGSWAQDMDEPHAAPPWLESLKTKKARRKAEHVLSKLCASVMAMARVWAVWG